MNECEKEIKKQKNIFFIYLFLSFYLFNYLLYLSLIDKSQN